MGASLDWSRERFTMDDGLSEAVKEVFVRLHEEGLIYRGKRLVNWDPVLHTAVSDLEVVARRNRAPVAHALPARRRRRASGRRHHPPRDHARRHRRGGEPGDERYRRLIGKTVTLPLTGREIPIIADDYVDPAFGTGCVKITPAHDFNDYAIGSATTCR
jgi:valyl-tRNA synthetase